MALKQYPNAPFITGYMEKNMIYKLETKYQTVETGI